MAITNKLKKLLHRKIWEPTTSLPAATAAGVFTVSDKFDLINGARAFLVAGVSSIWMYEGLEDAWMQLPNSGITGTFAAGSCGHFRGLGAMGGTFTQTATAGTTTTLTTNRTIVRSLAGQRVRVVAGTGVGYEGEVASNTLGANAIVTVTPANAVAFDATTQYQIYSGSLWFFNAGTVAVGFSVYDVATNAWTSRSVTGLPTAWGTDAQLASTLGSSGSSIDGIVSSSTGTTLVDTTKAWATNAYQNTTVRIVSGTGAGQIRSIASNTGTTLTISSAWTVNPDTTSVYSISTPFAYGIATAGAASTLTNSGKSWASNMWANYQVRITGGTGKGQIRPIASNTGTVLTVSTAWTVTPDATSTYAIEGNDDQFFLLGNNAVTMYRFLVSTNTWSTLAPTAARGGNYATGGTADWIDGVTGWDNETAVAHYSTTLFRQNGRYIFCFRGGASSTLDVYDIAANTWISAVAYGGQQETFTTGSSSVDMDGQIFINKEATGRIFRFDVEYHRLLPLATNTQQAALGGAAVTGNKMFLLGYNDGGTEIKFLYVIRNTSTDMVRMLLI